MKNETPNQNLQAGTVPPAKAEPEPYIDKKDLARRIRCGTRTIGRWMRNGTIPYYKINGKSVLFKWSEVEAHLRQTTRICRRVKFD